MFRGKQALRRRRRRQPPIARSPDRKRRKQRPFARSSLVSPAGLRCARASHVAASLRRAQSMERPLLPEKRTVMIESLSVMQKQQKSLEWEWMNAKKMGMLLRQQRW
jgi:hypothetical protein